MHCIALFIARSFIGLSSAQLSSAQLNGSAFDSQTKIFNGTLNVPLHELWQ